LRRRAFQGFTASEPTCADFGTGKFTKMPVCDVVVVGSYPPLPGPATEATLSAVRRAWDSGSTVGMASYRTGAASVRVPVAGPLAGWRLEQVRRHFGRPAQLVLTVQRGVPFCDDRLWPQLATAAGLAVAIRRFRQATVIVAEDPGIMPACLRAVVFSSRQCTVTTDADARSLIARYGLRPGAVAVTEMEPYPPRPEGVAPEDAGLYRPGAVAGLTVVELPTTTFTQRTRGRALRARARLLRQLLGR